MAEPIVTDFKRYTLTPLDSGKTVYIIGEHLDKSPEIDCVPNETFVDGKKHLQFKVTNITDTILHATVILRSGTDNGKRDLKVTTLDGTSDLLPNAFEVVDPTKEPDEPVEPVEPEESWPSTKKEKN